MCILMSLYTSTVSMSYLYTDVHPLAMASRSAVKSAGSWWDHNRYGPEFKPTGQAGSAGSHGIPIPGILWLGNTKGSKDG